ncbi:MAG TPA: hypothetical protein VE553_04595, partial [Candidatus Binatia bacterium]|nr:hypothetical protein [Candidatus Binatia bacterium]
MSEEATAGMTEGSTKETVTLRGNTHTYGDNVDTDRIIPGKYTKTLDQSQLAAHVLEDLDPQFSKRVQA